MLSLVELPDGRLLEAPAEPRTWTAEDRLRAPQLAHDVGGAVAFHRARPLFQALRTTALSVPTAAFTAVPLDGTELVDTHDGHSDDVNTSRWYNPYTPPDGNATDWYLINGHLPFSANATGVRIAALRVNGTGTVHEGMKIPGGGGHGASTQVIDLVQMGFNDYVELLAYQSSGAALNTVTGGKTPSLTARWASEGQGNIVALPSPRTWTAADVITADDASGGRIPLNVHIRDICRFLNYPPICRATSQGTAQTIPSGAGTWTSIQLPGTTATVDNYNGHDPATNNTRYVSQRPGTYYIAGLAAVAEAAAGVGYRAARLLHTKAAGGTTIYQGASTIAPAAATPGTALYASSSIRMAAGDYVEIQVQHTQGAAIAVKNGAGDCSKLIAVWMSL